MVYNGQFLLTCLSGEYNKDVFDNGSFTSSWDLSEKNEKDHSGFHDAIDLQAIFIGIHTKYGCYIPSMQQLQE